MLLASSISERLATARERIDAAARRAGRTGDIRLVAVSKSVPPAPILEAYRSGQRLFGENKVQEAATKIGELAPHMPDAEWHLVGHLQSNKAGRALDYFDLIESVDSVELAIRLDRLAGKSRHRQPILLEVNVAQEASKFGFRPDDLRQSLEHLLPLEHLELRGLMTVAPAATSPEEVRWVFRALRALRDAAREQWGAEEMAELSMGMSADFEVAVEEGATMVRIGTAIFGARPPISGGPAG